MLGAQVSRIEVEHADRVAAHEQLELVGRDPARDLSHDGRGVGPGRVLVRVVGFEAELLDSETPRLPDAIAFFERVGATAYLARAVRLLEASA